jgi:hypothetical protein
MSLRGRVLIDTEAEPFLPPAHRRVTVRLEQIQIAFPVGPGTEYQFRFADGTTSEWRPVPGGRVLKAPPMAEAIFWRRKVERERARAAKADPTGEASAAAP